MAKRRNAPDPAAEASAEELAPPTPDPAPAEAPQDPALAALTPEERQFLAEEEAGSPPAQDPGEATPPAKPAEAPEETPAEEPAAAAQPPATPEAKEAKPEELTPEQWRERAERAEAANKALRKEQIRARERARLAGIRNAAAPAAAPADPPAAANAGARVKFVLNEDGTYSPVGPEPEKALLGAPPAPAVAPEIIAAARNYEAVKSDWISRAEEPEVAKASIAELEDVFAWVDRRAADAFQELGVVPSGIDALMETLETAGIVAEFGEKYPGIELEELLQAPFNPLAFRRVVRTHMATKRAPAPPAAPANPAPPAAPAAAAPPPRPLPAGARPRPIGAQGRGGAGAPSPRERLVHIGHRDLLNATKDDLAEMERLAADV